MKPHHLEQSLKNDYIIGELKKLGFTDTTGLSYKELKRALVLERAKMIEVGSPHSSWF